MEAENVIIQSLDIANKRIITLESKYSSQKEKNKKVSKKLKEATGLCEKMTSEATKLLDGLNLEKTIFIDLVNGIFKELIITYGVNVEFNSGKILVKLGQTSDNTAYFAKIEFTEDKKYLIGPQFEDRCFRYFNNCNSCGCCIVNTINEVLEKVNDLKIRLPEFMTPEKILELRQVRPSIMTDMLRTILNQISGGVPIDIVEYPINFQ